MTKVNISNPFLEVDVIHAFIIEYGYLVIIRK